MRSPACVVYWGQPGTRTVPPVTSAAATNGPALDRSGSIHTSSALISGGSTRQVLGSESSTTAPASRSVSTVIRMCGSLGTGLPSWCTVTPSSYRAPASSSAEMNCEDAEASIVTDPPRTRPRPTHGQRQETVGVLELDAEHPQRVDDRAHRPDPGLGVAVQADRAVRERGDRRQEAHHGPSQTAVDGGAPERRSGGVMSQSWALASGSPSGATSSMPTPGRAARLP